VPQLVWYGGFFLCRIVKVCDLLWIHSLLVTCCLVVPSFKLSTIGSHAFLVATWPRSRS